MLDEIIIAKKQDEDFSQVCCIYCITNLINNKIYIGSTINLRNRMYAHFNSLKANRHYNNYLQYAFNKYGIENFVVNILEECECDQEIITLKEQHYIDIYKSYDSNIGYNLTRFVESRRVHSDESREKIRIANLNQTRKTHCIHGHEYTEENTLLYPKKNKEQKQRSCKTCKAIDANKRYLRKKEESEKLGLNKKAKKEPVEYCKRGHLKETLISGKKRCNQCSSLLKREKRIEENKKKNGGVFVPSKKTIPDYCKHGHKREILSSGKKICLICFENRKEIEKIRRRGLK